MAQWSIHVEFGEHAQGGVVTCPGVGLKRGMPYARVVDRHGQRAARGDGVGAADGHRAGEVIEGGGGVLGPVAGQEVW